MYINIRDLNNEVAYLSKMVEVFSLKSGAVGYGGATMINNKYYSNQYQSEDIKISDVENTIKILLPYETLDQYIQLNQFYHSIKELLSDELKEYNTVGSYEMENGEIAIDKLKVIEYKTRTLEIKDINFIIELMELFRQELEQESIGVFINNGLMIV